ncbi:MAG: hypothetical protein MR654_07840 [Corynebacterium glucuronolyticum]|nr:hypothetical protein [Corynebacterium glucuronolyticum]
MVKKWEDAPRNLEPDKNFFGAPLNFISGGEESFEAHYMVTILPDGGTPTDTTINAGEKTTINGFEISVDENDTVTVRHGDNFFTFDGTLTTQSWSQQPDTNGWSAPGAYYGRVMDEFGERDYFVGYEGGNCEVGLEAVRQYNTELANGGGEGVTGFWDNGSWQCLGDETYAPDIAGVDRMVYCKLGDSGDLWGANPSKYPNPQ